MKVKPEDLDKIQAIIATLDTPEVRAQYIARDIPRAEHVKDLDKRYRWDLFTAANLSVGYVLTDAVYAYANDTHLDTALRSIVPPLT